MESNKSLIWSAHCPHVNRLILRFFDKWKGTAHMAGQRSPRQGVDCLNLGAAFLEEMNGDKLGYLQLERLPQDAAVHDPEAWLRAMKAVRQTYPAKEIKGRQVEAGDILVCRATHDPDSPESPGHLMIAGPQPYTVIEALKKVRLGSVFNNSGVLHIFRPTNKDEW